MQKIRDEGMMASSADFSDIDIMFRAGVHSARPKVVYATVKKGPNVSHLLTSRRLQPHVRPCYDLASMMVRSSLCAGEGLASALWLDNPLI